MPPGAARMRVNGAITSRLGIVSAPSCRGSNSAGSFMAFNSFKRDVADVDIHQQRLGHEHIVAFVGVDASFGKELKSLDLSIVVGIIESRGAAQDIDGVIVTPKQSVRSETGDLLLGVTLDVIGKDHFEPAPSFSLDLDGTHFLGEETRLRVQKGRIEIGPQRLALEVRDVQRIPGCLSSLADKRGL